MRARVVDAGGVVVTVKGERGGLGGWDRGVASHVDVLGIVPLNIKEDETFFYQFTYIIIFNLTCPSCVRHVIAIIGKFNNLET